MKKSIILLCFVLNLLFILTFSSCSHENGKAVIKDAVTDVDGNSYDAVRIGDQVWMQSNLRTKHFKDGSEIPTFNENGDYIELYGTPYYAQPTAQDLSTYDEKTYGLYYNWPSTVDGRGLCPEGWHIPTSAEWTQLELYVKELYTGSYLKALASQAGWNQSSDPEDHEPGYKPLKNNATGFTAVPVGYLHCNPDNGSYGYAGNGDGTQFWTSTYAFSTGTWSYTARVGVVANDHTSSYVNDRSVRGCYGLPVRCVRNPESDF